MPYYFEGYDKAKQQVKTATLDELLDILDTLYGRDNLKYGDDIEAVRKEAYRQIQREFTNTSSEEYRIREFWRS